MQQNKDRLAQKLLEFYGWTEFSAEFIADILSSIEDIEHIGKRMEAFFSRLDKREINKPLNISILGREHLYNQYKRYAFHADLMKDIIIKDTDFASEIDNFVNL